MDKSNLYQLDGRVPVAQAIPFGLQHVLAMFLWSSCWQYCSTSSCLRLRTQEWASMRNSIILSLILALSAIGADAQFLFRISGNGLKEPSYMLGTAHNMPASAIDSIPDYAEAEAKCRLLYTEYDFTDQNKVGAFADTLRQKVQSLTLPDGKTIFDVLNKEQVDTLSSRVNAMLHVNLRDSACIALWHFQPVGFTSLLVGWIQFEVRKQSGQTPQITSLIDMACVQRARERGMEIRQLDELQDWQEIRKNSQAQNLLTQDIDTQVDTLMAVLRTYDRRLKAALDEAEGMKQIGVCMRAGDYDGFAAMDYIQRLVTSNPSLFLYRNEKWLPKMKEAMSEAPTMFDFGAAHFVGDEGIIAKLREAGYTVEQVKKE